MRNLALGLLGVLLMLSACGEQTDQADSTTPAEGGAVTAAPPRADGEAAVWEVDPAEEIDESSTTFTALVSRLGCNGGVTGQVLDPVVESDATQVVVRFAVAPKEPGAANCQGNDLVPVEVDLGEPLGDRSLVDGECLPGGEAPGTAFCDPDGVRFDGG